MLLARSAEQHLKQKLEMQGWNILAQNYRGIGFELDLVASKGSSLVLFEVKARRQNKLPDLNQLLPPRKKAALIRGLHQFLSRQSSNQWQQLRLDLVVLLEKNGKWQEHIYTDVDPY